MQQQGSAEGMRSRMPEAMLCTTVETGGVSGLAAHPCHLCLCLLRLSSVPALHEEEGRLRAGYDKIWHHLPVVTWGADLKGFVRHRTGI